MTVQELINELNKVEDKSLPVYYYEYEVLGDMIDIDEIEEHKDDSVLLFKNMEK